MKTRNYQPTSCHVNPHPGPLRTFALVLPLQPRPVPLHHLKLPTEVCRVVVAWTVQPCRRQCRDQVRPCASVNAAAVSQDVELVELLEEPAGGLVDGADDCPAALGQGLQQGDAGGAGSRVQTAAEWRGETIRYMCHASLTTERQ